MLSLTSVGHGKPWNVFRVNRILYQTLFMNTVSNCRILPNVYELTSQTALAVSFIISFRWIKRQLGDNGILIN